MKIRCFLLVVNCLTNGLFSNQFNSKTKRKNDYLNDIIFNQYIP